MVTSRALALLGAAAILGLLLYTIASFRTMGTLRSSSYAVAHLTPPPLLESSPPPPPSPSASSAFIDPTVETRSAQSFSPPPPRPRSSGAGHISTPARKPQLSAGGGVPQGRGVPRASPPPTAGTVNAATAAAPFAVQRRSPPISNVDTAASASSGSATAATGSVTAAATSAATANAAAVNAAAVATVDAAPGASAETTGLALHKSAKRWLDGCANSSAALLDSRLPSSEYWRERRAYRIYKHQYCLLLRYAPRASSVLDVGSALPPFVNALHWIKRRTILGPRFAGNVAKGGADLFSVERIQEKCAPTPQWCLGTAARLRVLAPLPTCTAARHRAPHRAPHCAPHRARLGPCLSPLCRYHVSAVPADFLEWTPPGWAASQVAEARAAPPPLYDLVLCSEVVEHVATPREFVRKLLAVGEVVVLSVPYRWAPCGGDCHHKQNMITRDKIATWAGRQPLAYDIVEEASGEKRIICVYRRAASGDAPT